MILTYEQLNDLKNNARDELISLFDISLKYNINIGIIKGTLINFPNFPKYFFNNQILGGKLYASKEIEAFFSLPETQTFLDSLSQEQT
jgi:hypothetical protein